VDTPHPPPAPPPGGSRRREGELSLIQAAVRRRTAERAFEDYVREMAQRWNPAPGAGDGPDPADPMPPRMS
jgi:hypothetical protein